MKILHLTKKYPQALGGDAVVVYNLREQQKKAGHEVAIVTSKCDEITEAPGIYKVGFRDAPARLDVITLKRLASLGLLFFQMFAILRRERPDVMHTHSIDMAFFASFAARFYGIPIVHTFHIVTFYDVDQSAIRRKSELWLAKMAGLQAATTPNSYDVRQLQTAGFSQTVLLPNGVDLAFWQTDKQSDGHDIFTFVTVGRLEEQKGYEFLIKAAALLADTIPGAFQVIIVGEGSQLMALQKLVRSLHVERVVKIVGRKSPEEIRSLFSQSDVAVFPSLYETTPLTMLEAWAAAIPVIVTAVGIVRGAPANFDAAYVVPPKDEQALMKAMSRCMTGAAARIKTGARGYKEAQRYSWPIIAQTAEAIYRSVSF